MTKPMTDERLAEIDARCEAHLASLEWDRAWEVVHDLLAEVERLKGEIEQLESVSAEMESEADGWLEAQKRCVSQQEGLLAEVEQLKIKNAYLNGLHRAVSAYPGFELRTADYLREWASAILPGNSWKAEWLAHVADALQKLAGLDEDDGGA